MAKIKFTINRESLLEEANQNYFLTRVPQSNMQYYLLLNQNDIVSADDKTLVAEFDSEQMLNVVPGIRQEGSDRFGKPDMQTAIAGVQNPEQTVQIKAEELYDQYYVYQENMDPTKRREMMREREQKRQEALSNLEHKNGNVRTAADSSRTPKNQQQAQAGRQQTQTNRQQQGRTQAHNNASAPETVQKFYSKKQFQEIKKGIRQHLDTKKYQNIDLNPQQMKELRMALKAGLDVSTYNSPYVSARYMKEIRIGAKRGVRFDLAKLDHSLYNAEQLHELRLGFEKQLNVKKYINPNYSAAQMKELRLAMQAGFDTASLEDIHLSADQMHSMRIRMVFDRINEVLERMFNNLREWMSEKTNDLIERLKADYQGREPMTREQIKAERIAEAVAEIKETLVESELVTEEAYNAQNLDDKITESIQEWQEYMEYHPEQDVEAAVNDVSEDICEAANIKEEQPDVPDEKVVSIKQKQEMEEAAREEAIEKAIEEELQQNAAAHEMVIEEERWEAMIQ